MGRLIDGKWTARDDAHDAAGAFRRADSRFRNWVTPDGAPGPTGTGGFRAESGRYHLYVSYACPWAHRTLIWRALKGLEDHVGVSVVHPDMLDDGWTFQTDDDGATGDRLMGKAFLREVYLEADPRATTRVTVPVLWDAERRTIVSNESSEIVRMFDEAFSGVTGRAPSMRPEGLREQIDALNARIYDTVNNGVYKAGFARAQAAHEAAVTALFDTLDWLEERLSTRRYLTGPRVTEADWRLFTTAVRFDPVYVCHFKCNLRRLSDHPNLWGWTRELFQTPGVAATVNMRHIKRHYFFSHRELNPAGLVPLGPMVDFAAPHERARPPART